jgi:hypothetical protein
MTYPPVPGGWQDPAGGSGEPAAEQPTYIDPLTNEPATINPGPPATPDPGQAVTPPGYPTDQMPGYPAAQYPVTGYPPAGQPGYGQPYDPSGQQPYSDPSGQQPYSAPPGYGYPQQGGYPGYGYPTPVMVAAARNNGLAIASMVVSLAGAALLFCYGFGGVAGLVGAILGHVARRQVTRRGENGGGMALAGIIVGWVVFALGIVIVIGAVWAISWAMHDQSNLYTPDPTSS